MGSKRKANRNQVGKLVYWPHLLALLLIPILVALTYGRTIKAPFAFDDRVHILENTQVTSFESILDLSAMVSVFRNPSGIVGRPLLMITYGLNYAVSGANPKAFRRVNLLIHTANSLFVFLIALELASFSGPDLNRLYKSALLAAALFAVHPMLTESVTYIAGRSSSLCATFYFACLYTALKAGREASRRKWVLVFMTGVFTLVGLLVKQDANVLPLACIALIWLAWPSTVANRVRWASTAALALLTLLTIAAQFRGLVGVSQTTQNNSALVAAGFETTLPLAPYVLTSITGFSGYYLWRFLAPLRLSIDPEMSAIATWTSTGFIASMVVLISLTVLLFRLRSSKPLAAAGLALVLMSPLSAYCVFPLADVIAEHRAYITVLGVVIIFADIMLSVPYTVVFSLLLVGAYTWATIERNKVWSDEVLLWSDASRLAPEKIRPHLNLGALYQSRGQVERAVQEYQFVLAREPGHSSALANLASIYLESDLGKAEEFLDRAIALNSTFPAVYLNLGVVRLRQKRFAEAKVLLERAISLNPNQLMAHLDLGDVFFNLGQPSNAIPEYLSEIRLNRDFEMTHLHLAVAYEVTGMKEKAIEEYRITVRLNPANPQAQAALERLK